jgi:amino acid permease
VLIGAIAALTSLKMLLGLAEEVKAQSFSHLIRKVFGHKIDRFLSILLFFGISGSCISY